MSLDFFNFLGKKITSLDVHQTWFGGKKPKENMPLKKLGLEFGLRNAHDERVQVIHFYGEKMTGFDVFTGVLPENLAFSMSRKAVRAKMGEPKKSGEPSGSGIFAVEFAWDFFEKTDGSTIRFEYQKGGSAIRMIQIAAPDESEKIRSAELKVMADYYQFYVQDIDSKCDTSIIWDDPKTTEKMLAVGPQLVAVGTKRYSEVDVRIEFYPTEPAPNFVGIDRVNECGLEITMRLGVGNFVSLEKLVEIDFVPPGIYRVRILYARLATVVDDWTGSDLYVVQLWPAEKLVETRHVKP